MKYVPEFLLPQIKPKIIDNIVKENDILGKIAGVNLKPVDFNNESQLKEYLNAIIKLKTEDCTLLFIEGSESLSKESIDYIEEYVNLKIPDGEYTRITNLPKVMKEIYDFLEESLQEKEVLVLCDNKEKAKNTIKSIAKDTRFITIVGCDQASNDDIYNYILEEAGLSLFYSSNIYRILESYSIIINFIDTINFDFSRMRRNCIVFDFSRNAILKNIKGNRNVLPSIEDFAFNLTDLGIDATQWLNNKVDSSLSEALMENNNQNIKYLFSADNYYSIKDYVNSFIKVKGRL